MMINRCNEMAIRSERRILETLSIAPGDADVFTHDLLCAIGGAVVDGVRLGSEQSDEIVPVAVDAARLLWTLIRRHNGEYAEVPTTTLSTVRQQQSAAIAALAWDEAQQRWRSEAAAYVAQVALWRIAERLAVQATTN